ncbi:MAG TPA: glycosyltransferase family 4 protein [Pyrinomonadaceae bacterium]|nr:glycosyltransferase family 4 protein [Pyrinomonadaceae bacterium]
MFITIQSSTFGAYGGIPVYNRLVCRALNEFPGTDNALVLIATDKVSDLEEPSIQLSTLRLQAFDGNRLALARSFLSVGLQQKIDLVLVGHVNYAPLAWFLKQLQPSLKYGVLLYGIEAWRPLSALRRRALQKADFLISISNFTKQEAVDRNELDPGRIYILSNALDCVEPQCRQTVRHEPLPSVGARLLSVCRLEENERYKGVEKVIECLPELVKRLPDVRYTVVGGGTDLERHRQLAARLGIDSQVHFPGVVSEEVLNECYRDCDVFVMPSAGEGFGFVFLEAMKYGKPIVAARSGGVPEVVRDGVNGKLVEYGDKQQLMESLLELCLNPDLRENLGRAGYQRLQENYTFEHFKQKFTEIIRLESPAHAASKFSPSESHSCAS